MAMDEGPYEVCRKAVTALPLVLEFALTGKWWRAKVDVPKGQACGARHHQNTARKAESEGLCRCAGRPWVMCPRSNSHAQLRAML